MSLILYVTLAFFAGIRIMRMLYKDTGPLGVFDWFRTILETVTYKTGNLNDRYWYWLWYIVNSFDTGFNCAYCLSVWVYGALAFLFYISGMATPIHSIIIWLGLSGIFIIAYNEKGIQL